jgi:hypothetical protein
MDGGSKTLVRPLTCLRRMTLLTALQKGGNVMNRGSAAAFVHQTELKQTGLAVHLRPCRQGWRRIATAAIALAGENYRIKRTKFLKH